MEPEPCDRYGQNCFQKACHLNQVYLVTQLLQNPYIDPSQNDNQAIQWACANGYMDVIDILLKDQRVDPTSAMFNAVRYSHLQIVDRLMQDARVVTQDHINSILNTACISGSIQVVDRLLSYSVPPTDFNDVALKAYNGQHYNIVVRMLPFVNSHEKDRILSYAIEDGYRNIVECILYDPDPNINLWITIVGIHYDPNVDVILDRILSDGTDGCFYANLLMCNISNCLVCLLGDARILHGQIPPPEWFHSDEYHTRLTAILNVARCEWYRERFKSTKELHTELIATYSHIYIQS